MLDWVCTSWAEIMGHCSSSESQSRAWNCAVICTQPASGAVTWLWPKTAVVEPPSEGPGTEGGIKQENIPVGNEVKGWKKSQGH